MIPIEPDTVQQWISRFANQPIFIHLETTQGAYAARNDETILNTGAFIRNVQISFTQGKITGAGPYRVGLKLEQGWLYAEGLTHWETTKTEQLLLAGHDQNGKLGVALELSQTPFPH